MRLDIYKKLSTLQLIYQSKFNINILSDKPNFKNLLPLSRFSHRCFKLWNKILYKYSLKLCPKLTGKLDCQIETCTWLLNFVQSEIYLYTPFIQIRLRWHTCRRLLVLTLLEASFTKEINSDQMLMVVEKSLILISILSCKNYSWWIATWNIPLIDYYKRLPLGAVLKNCIADHGKEGKKCQKWLSDCMTTESQPAWLSTYLVIITQPI